MIAYGEFLKIKSLLDSTDKEAKNLGFSIMSNFPSGHEVVILLLYKEANCSLKVWHELSESGYHDLFESVSYKSKEQFTYEEIIERIKKYEDPEQENFMLLHILNLSAIEIYKQLPLTGSKIITLV